MFIYATITAIPFKKTKTILTIKSSNYIPEHFSIRNEDLFLHRKPSHGCL